MAELMDQQCGLVQSLQHQTECPYRYFRKYEGMFRNVFCHCWNKPGLVISFGVMYTCEGGFCLQNYFISLNLNQLQYLKFDIVYDNVLSLQAIVVYTKFLKEIPVVGWGK